MVVTDSFSFEFTLYGLAGEPQKLSLEPHLTDREKGTLAETGCGKQWVRKAHLEGELLVLEIPTRGILPPIFGQSKGTVLSFDPKTRQFTRGAPAPGK